MLILISFLDIFPKVFKEDEDDTDVEDLDTAELMQNLLFWLGYCDRLNFPFVQFKSSMTEADTLLELFITVYVHYVKNALEKQRFFRYEEITETGSFVKGKIDFRNYVTRKVPTGNHAVVDYTYSSFVFDNLLNRIIKCTCRQLLNMTGAQSNKRVIQKILISLADITDVNCLPYDCDKVKLNSLQNSYSIILSMSKMFLMNKSAGKAIGTNETFCFLFPAEVLFEGFIGGFMREMLSGFAHITTQASSQYLADLVVDGEIVGNTFLLKEDIVVEFDDSIIVLDTKYKEIERFEKVRESRKLKISDNDMKQMAIYAAKRGAKKLFLLYPLHKNDEPETIEVIYNIKLEGIGAAEGIPLEILKVPFAYRESESSTKALLRDILSKVTK